MKELAILGVVISYILLIVSHHLLNGGYRQKNDDFSLVFVIIAQLFSLILFWGSLVGLVMVYVF